ncbi:TnpV protein [uncultured Eubacterium sp.]|uniref:TnpV protein n=1 Tax=uncultured Eubacterium sp. TaxID=165185 RepID=UPI0015B0231A|nr:TnpV protein [uncultured Eubacterium sp.]
MKTIFEQQGVEYCQVGDYMLPNVGLNAQQEYPIGVWGQRYRKHLKENRRIIYYNYLTKGTLNKHLAEVDIRAEKMFQQLVKSLAEKENVTEKLKAENTFLWIRKMNNIRNRATEVVNVEVIYI